MTPEQIEEIAERHHTLDTRRPDSQMWRDAHADRKALLASHRELQERVEALENALDQVASLMHGLPRGKTADHVERICREAYRQGE